MLAKLAANLHGEIQMLAGSWGGYQKSQSQVCLHTCISGIGLSLSLRRISANPSDPMSSDYYEPRVAWKLILRKGIFGDKSSIP